MRKKTREYGFQYRAFDRHDTPRVRRLDFYRGMRRTKYFKYWFSDIGEYCRVSDPWGTVVLPPPNMMGIPQSRDASAKMLAWMASYGKRDDIKSVTSTRVRFDLHHHCRARVAVVDMESPYGTYSGNHAVLSYVVTPRRCHY